MQEVLDRFVVFEGIDGAGKSTQAALLCNYIRQHGQNCYLTREPTTDLGPEPNALKYAHDRADHLYSGGGIIEHLRSGWWCVCDRYLFSSLAYQGAEAIRCNAVFPLPRFVVWLHIPPKQIPKRCKPGDDAAYLRRVQSRYNQIMKALPGQGVRLITLDASREVEHTQQQIRLALDPLLS